MILNDTIVANATGMNNSGIGIIRISGKDSFKIAEKIFYKKSGKKYNKFDSHRVYYGFIKDDEDIVDEVLLIALMAPKSFTTEDTIEINCHGGLLVQKKIINLVIKNGARLAEPGEFTKRAFLNGRIDLSSAEAVIDLINSKNNYSLNNSLKQLTGSLYEKIKNIREKIIYEIAFIESALDDPEHISLEGYSEELFTKIEKLIFELKKLSNSFSEGRIISEGISTVIIGKPNVGKSTLLNILSGYDKAIVTNIAGTTRDAIEENILINGINLKIIDTAGIRDTEDIVEKIGVDKAIEYANNADLIFMLIDSSVEMNKEDRDLFELIKEKKAIILLNKSDLSQIVSVDDIKELIDKPIIQISAKNDVGIDELKNLIEQMFLNGSLSFNDELVITNERHLCLINEALSSLNEVKSSIQNYIPEDFLSIDLTNAYNSLGSIIGELMDDDVVNEIFSKFCMGK